MTQVFSRKAHQILIVGASPDRINRNSVLRTFVRQGFSSLLGENIVFDCPLESSVESVRRLRPKLVICFGSCMPDIAEYGPLRDICDQVGADIAFWLHDDPYEFDYGYKAVEVADWLFVNDKWATRHYMHPHVYHLPMAGCPKTYLRSLGTEKKFDVFFCGVAFLNRQQIVRDIEPFLKNMRCQILGDGWPDNIKFAQNRRLSSTEMADCYAASLVTLNLGRDLHLANMRFQLDPSTPGPRTFEAALAGSVQMFFADSLEIIDYFEPDKEILLFDSPESFIYQLKKLQTYPQKAEQIAKAAQERALQDHTYEKRAAKLLSLCGFSIF